MKESLLKWATHLGKGTTWGYATRKDCSVVFGFLVLLNLPLSFVFYLVRAYCFAVIGIEEEFILIEFILINLTSCLSLVFLITIIANFSITFMRINDICGKRYFTTKGHIFAFIVICFLMVILGYFAKNAGGFFLLLFYIIMCIYPSSSGEREEMPTVEYKLPKKAILVLAYILLAIYSLSLYGPILFAKNSMKPYYMGY
jgi:uncharacterized membrane protein YhaH (DUF805 family)